jgi:hypothetical protein
VPTRRKVQMPQIVEPVLPGDREAADQAGLKGESGFQADATVVRAALHEEMLARVTILEALIASVPKQPIGIGHNQPSITQEDVAEIKEAIAVLKAQPVMPTAPDKARAAGLTLMRFGERLGTYLLKQAEVFVSEAVKSGGKEFGKRLVQSPLWWALATALMLVAQSVSKWLPLNS